jgi:virginiamycin B lyase
MTANDRIDARLSGLMHDLAGSADEPLNEVLRQTARMRQRPAWTFPERWLPMTEIAAQSIPQFRRPLLLVAALLLLVAAFAVVASGVWRQRELPLPAQVDIEAAAAQRFELSGAAYPAVGLDRLWVTAGGAGIAELDPTTGELLATTQIDGGSCGSIAVAFGRVWTPTCQIGGVAALDPDGTQTAVRFGIPVVDEEATVGVGDDALWVVAGGLADQLVKVDPASLQIADTFLVAPGSTHPEAGFASVWLASKNAGTVVRMDPNTGAVKATIRVGALPRFLAIGEGSVWVVNQADGTVTRINPRFNRVTTTIEVGPLDGAGGIEIAGGYVWVRGVDDVAQIDPDQNRVVAFYGPAPGRGGIGSDGVSLWITSPDANLVWRLPGT